MDHHDRRQSFRVPIDGALATCVGERNVETCWIHNLSRKGALLISYSEIPKETNLRVNLKLPRKPLLKLDAIVRRSSMSARNILGVQTAIEFCWLNDEEQDVIADTIEDCFSNYVRPTTIVCTSSKSEGRALIHTLQSIGIASIHELTALCALKRLMLTSQYLKAVVMGANLTGTTAMETASFLADNHPHLRRIFVGNPSWRTRIASRSLFHSIVHKPWTSEELQNALSGI